MAYDSIVSRSMAQTMVRERVSGVALNESGRKAKSAADLTAELARHKANNETMNKAIREKMKGC